MADRLIVKTFHRFLCLRHSETFTIIFLEIDSAKADAVPQASRFMLRKTAACVFVYAVRLNMRVVSCRLRLQKAAYYMAKSGLLHPER